MSKLWDIINFAHETGIADAEFTATFDPEHIALMEAVVQAAIDLSIMADSCPYCTNTENASAADRVVTALLDYRKERDLDG